MTEVADLTARLGIAGLAEFTRGMAQADASVDALRKQLRGLTEDALAARAALAGLGVDVRAVAETAALKTEVKGVRDAAAEADVAMREVKPADSAIAKTAAFAAMVGHLRDNALEAAAALRLGGGGDRGGGDLGYTGTGLLTGILPGGRRASAAAVTTGIGILAASGPAVLPSVAALAPIAGAGVGTLIGAAGTLKLAFADLTAAAFSNRQAFLALTPVQQAFVQTLRSVDAGLLKGNLEPLAQRTLLPQLSAALHAALTPSAVGALQGGVSAFGNAIGGGAQQLGALFGSAGFANQFGTMLAQDAGYLRTFLDAATRLFDGFVRFQVAAGPFLAWVGQVALAFAKWADAAVRADAANGRLAAFFGIVKTSLQTVGSLLLSVGHLAGALFDAIGFRNSVGLVTLLTKAVNDLAALLHSNARVFRDFFAGALGAATDLVKVINFMLQGLKPVLSALDSLIGGAHGFKLAIEALGVAWLLFQSQFIAGAIRMGAALIAAIPELAIVAALVLIVTHWKQTTEIFVALWQAQWKAMEGIMAYAIYGILKGFSLILDGLKKGFGWVPVIGGQLSSVSDAFSTWVDKFKQTGQQDFHSAGVLAGQAWGDAFASTSTAIAAGLFQSVTSLGQANPMFGMAALGAKNALGKPPPFGSTGTGFTVPNSYLLAIAKAQAQPGTGPQITALRSVIAYLRNTIPGLSPANQTTAYGDLSSYEQQLNSLLGTGSSTSGVGFLSQAAQTRLAHAQQAAAGITGTTPVTTQNLRDVVGLVTQLAADHTMIAAQIAKGAYAGAQRTKAVAEEVALTTQLVAAQKVLAGLRLQVPPGVEARLQQALQRTAGLTSTSPATDQNITALNGLLAQQTAAIKILTEEMKKAGSSSEKQAADKQRTTLKDQHAATLRLRDTLEQTRREAGILGIGTGAGTASAARETATVRLAVNALLHQFGLAQTGSSPLGPFVHELYRMGDINKRQYESLEKILKVITDAKKGTDTIASSITGNISARLAEIKQELETQTGFTLSGAQHALSGILRMSGARLTGSAAQRARFLEEGQFALAHHGEVLSTNRAALGVPLTRGGGPSYTRHDIHVTVDARGVTAIDKAAAVEIAGAVESILRRKTLRNSTQLTGSSAGVNMGF